MAKITLRDYQREAIEKSRFLASFGFFMGTGTGKTITSLERSLLNPTKHLLVVCPKSVVTQWGSVINTHYPQLEILKFPKETMNAKQKDEYIKNLKKLPSVIIINFEIIYKVKSLLDIINEEWTIIVDESHKIKDIGTQRNPVKQTAALLKLSPLTPYKMILTATPTQGNYGGYIDLYSQLNFLGYLDISYTQFKNRYTITEKKVVRGRPYPISVITGYKNTEEIDKILKLTCFRYIPKAGDFPPEHIKVMIPRAKSYARVRREMVYKEILLNNSARKRVGLKTLTGGRIHGMDAFKQKYKYDDNKEKIDWLREFLENTEETVTIFYQYNVEKELIEELLKKLGKTYVLINGDTKDKHAEINNKDYKVALGQYQAMSESLDGLQYKSHIEILYSMPESSLTYTQAIGRIDRIGQESVPIYYYLVMEKTIDENIYNLIEQKVEYSEETLEKLNIWED